jgi:hypothetical protein
MNPCEDQLPRAAWLRSQIQRVSTDLIWCLAEFRLRGTNREPITSADLRHLEDVSEQLHRWTRELRALSATSGDVRAQALGPWDLPLHLREQERQGAERQREASAARDDLLAFWKNEMND